ncbi:TraR/DksA family transcriptional regulator [Acidimicrobium ferrooxidans]|uniref:TraR/DksA family transcriptional regulator n=1 Tax=Acidimicrobium ferrooxidans TaxID=53635 RepID=UPI00019DDE9A|nr:TraR/DksA C4-type zinc finger protein [Acidimicrobium ferrooxidans]
MAERTIPNDERAEAYLALDEDELDALDEGTFIEEQRNLLLVERAHLEQQASQLKAEADQLVQTNGPLEVQFDEESGEGGTAAIDRERDLALAASARAALSEVADALAKIDAGTYGACEVCHEPIARARLRALPYARLCVRCKEGGLTRRR